MTNGSVYFIFVEVLNNLQSFPFLSSFSIHSFSFYFLCSEKMFSVHFRTNFPAVDSAISFSHFLIFFPISLPFILLSFHFFISSHSRILWWCLTLVTVTFTDHNSSSWKMFGTLYRSNVVLYSNSRTLRCLLQMGYQVGIN